jgi:hypothetical protein
LALQIRDAPTTVNAMFAVAVPGVGVVLSVAVTGSE